MLYEASTPVTLMVKPVSETRQVEGTVPSKGAVVPDAPTAASEIVLLVGAEPQSMLTAAVTVVPAAGDST